MDLCDFGELAVTGDKAPAAALPGFQCMSIDTSGCLAPRTECAVHCWVDWLQSRPGDVQPARRSSLTAWRVAAGAALAGWLAGWLDSWLAGLARLRWLRNPFLVCAQTWRPTKLDSDTVFYLCMAGPRHLVRGQRRLDLSSSSPLQ